MMLAPSLGRLGVPASGKEKWRGFERGKEEKAQRWANGGRTYRARNKCYEIEEKKRRRMEQ
jgi:hypothetical protein